MFSRMVVEKRRVSCRTIPICARKDFLVIVRKSLPSSVTDPASRIVKARHQTEQGAFASAGPADHGHDLVRRDLEVDVMKDSRSSGCNRNETF